MIVVSTGCPASIGPEISVRAAFALGGAPCVLVGDLETLRAAAALTGHAPERLLPWQPEALPLQRGEVYVCPAGPALLPKDRKPGRPSPTSGQAQLVYIETAYALAKRYGAALVTAAVSKAAIAKCGLPRARTFLGHTEWLERLDSAPSSTMCFYSPRLSTSLVTTHLPLSRVPKALDASGVARATVHLAHMLLSAGVVKPRLAVASLNPHAGESALLGNEEARAIVPGVREAKRRLASRAQVSGPVGAETAYRLAYSGQLDGVVAMYHDQATIPMKLVAFGEAVNVTMGLSIVRTSVDHGTAYDIAWRGEADIAGMSSALQFAARLSSREARANKSRDASKGVQSARSGASGPSSKLLASKASSKARP